MDGWRRIFNEPVLLATAVRLSLIAAIAMGWMHLTMDQILALMAAVEAILALITRSFVTPNHIAEARVDAGGRPSVPLNKQP